MLSTTHLQWATQRGFYQGCEVPIQMLCRASWTGTVSRSLDNKDKTTNQAEKTAVRAIAHTLTGGAQDHCAQASDPALCHEITHVADSHQYLGTSITNQAEMTSTLEASEDFVVTLNLGQCSSKCRGQ